MLHGTGYLLPPGVIALCYLGHRTTGSILFTVAALVVATWYLAVIVRRMVQLRREARSRRSG